MLRDINTDVLIKLGINAHQYIILIMLVNKYHDHLERYLIDTNSYDSFPDDLKYLSSKSLVEYPENKPYSVKSIEVQSDFIRTLRKDNMFTELYEVYPNKITRPDGSVDYLRKNKRMCEEVYSIMTKGDPQIHEHIISCLRYELNYRKRNNGMQWMKRLSKWLGDREWENFEDLVADGSSLKLDNTYGTQLE